MWSTAVIELQKQAGETSERRTNHEHKTGRRHNENQTNETHETQKSNLPALRSSDGRERVRVRSSGGRDRREDEFFCLKFLLLWTSGRCVPHTNTPVPDSASGNVRRGTTFLATWTPGVRRPREPRSHKRNQLRHPRGLPRGLITRLSEKVELPVKVLVVGAIESVGDPKMLKSQPSSGTSSSNSTAIFRIKASGMALRSRVYFAGMSAFFQFPCNMSVVCSAPLSAIALRSVALQLWRVRVATFVRRAVIVLAAAKSDMASLHTDFMSVNQ